MARQPIEEYSYPWRDMIRSRDFYKKWSGSMCCLQKNNVGDLKKWWASGNADVCVEMILSAGEVWYVQVVLIVWTRRNDGSQVLTSGSSGMWNTASAATSPGRESAFSLLVLPDGRTFIWRCSGSVIEKWSQLFSSLNLCFWNDGFESPSIMKEASLPSYSWIRIGHVFCSG